MHKSLSELNKGLHCSFITFFRYKPFYMTPPTEREKESCLCMKCQNVHLLLRGINTYRNMKKITKRYSVTQFIRSNPKNDTDTFPEYNDMKEKTVISLKVKLSHTQKTIKLLSIPALPELIKKIYDIVEKLFAKSKSYLCRRFHVHIIVEVFPMIWERFTGKYIELDFSKNLALKPKFEV